MPGTAASRRLVLRGSNPHGLIGNRLPATSTPTQELVRMHPPRWSSPACAAAAFALLLPLAVFSLGSRAQAAPAEVVPPDEPAAATTLFDGLVTGVTEAATDEIISWGLGALGLNNSQGSEFAAISSELAQISEELDAIESELEQLDSDILQQTCDLETYDTTTSARATIDDVTETYGDLVTNGGDADDIQAFLDEVFDPAGDGANSIQYQLEVISDALLSSGPAGGIIQSCLATLAEPTAGTLGDTDYYDAVANLTMFFYGYQAEGAALLAEAYHYEAYQSWAETSDVSSLSPADVSDICTAPLGEVATDCANAKSAVEDVWEHLQDQFALAGAPLSVEGETAIYNGTPDLWVLSLEALTTSAGADCTLPLTTSDPCGPTEGNNLLTEFDLPDGYAGRTDWAPADAPQWGALLAAWTNGGTTAGTYLNALGFSNAENKILLTPTTYTAQPIVYVDGEAETLFSKEAACFVDTDVTRSNSIMPNCNNGSAPSGTSYGKASDLLETTGYWRNGDCGYSQESDWLPSETSNGYFYVGRWYSSLGPDDCDGDYWNNGTIPGWLIDTRGYTYDQLLWPAVDSSAVTCNANQDQSTRSTTNVSGVPTMCGDDFDAWFTAIVPSPFDAATSEPEAPTTTTTTPISTPTAAQPVSGDPTYTG